MSKGVKGGRGKWGLLEHGGGLCVGKLFLSVEWKVVSGSAGKAVDHQGQGLFRKG